MQWKAYNIQRNTTIIPLGCISYNSWKTNNINIWCFEGHKHGKVCELETIDVFLESIPKVYRLFKPMINYKKFFGFIA
jgi:hypothetical protein